MLFSRKIALFVTTALMVSAVSACSSNVTPVAVSLNGETSFADSNLVTRISENVTQSKQDPSHFYIDAGNGQKTGASFSVKLNFGDGGNFKVKANDSSNGTPTALITDLSKLRVVLIASNTVPTIDLTGAVSVGGSTTTLLSSKTGATPTVTFTNVPGATGSGTRYWVAAAAYKSDGTTNITNMSGTLLDTTYGKFYVTNGGGDTTTSAGALSGSTKVTQTVTTGGSSDIYSYAVSDVGALTMALKLRDATGATVGSDVTVTDGGDRLSTIGAI